MFERYTESARRALFFARYECSQFGWLTIELEHLLLGIFHEPRGVTAAVLARLDCSPQALRRQFELRWSSEKLVPQSLEIPFAEATRQALNAAAVEADRLGHNYIGCEHLLLGVLGQDGSPAAAILAAHGLHLDEARSMVKSAGAAPDPGGAISGMLQLGHTSPAAVEGIKAMVRQLGVEADPRARQALVDRIIHALDGLGRPL